MDLTILAVATALLLSAAPAFAGGWTVDFPSLTFPAPGTETPQPPAETSVSTRRAGG